MRGLFSRNELYNFINFLRRDDFDAEYFLRKIEKDPYLLKAHSTISGFENIIKEIYNYRNKNKIS